MASNAIATRQSFHWIGIVGEKSLVKQAPVYTWDLNPVYANILAL